MSAPAASKVQIHARLVLAAWPAGARLLVMKTICFDHSYPLVGHGSKLLAVSTVRIVEWTVEGVGSRKARTGKMTPPNGTMCSAASG